MQILLDQIAGSHHFIFCYNWSKWSNDLLSFQLAMSSKLRSQSIFYLFIFKFLPLRTKFIEGIKSLSLDGKYIVHPRLTNNSCKLLWLCKFQSKISEYFYAEYKRIFPYRIIDQMLNPYQKKRAKNFLIKSINLIDIWVILELRLYQSVKTVLVLSKNNFAILQRTWVSFGCVTSTQFRNIFVEF